MRAIGYWFNWYAVPLVLTSLTSLTVGVVVLRREWESTVGRAFFLVSVVIALWAGAEAVMYCAMSPELALAWARVVYVAVPFIPVSIYAYNIIALRTFRQYRVMLALLVVASVAFAVIAQVTDLLIADIQSWRWGFGPRYGSMGPAFVTFFALVIAIGGVQYRAQLVDAPRGST